MSVTTAGRLRDIRRAAGWTQAELAERAGVAPRRLSRLEHGARPAPNVALSLARALDVHFAEERIR
jgi:transcriptional regulator with XRE-family HTH domain